MTRAERAVTVTLRGRTAYLDGPRGLIVKAIEVTGAAWMVDRRERVLCVSVTRADDVMVALEHHFHARVHLVDETSLSDAASAS